MDLKLPFLSLACSMLDFAQAVAPVPGAPAPSRAAPVGFPAPSFLPAGAGAPVVGQPGQEAPRPLPRSPNTRVLPPTAELGLWAADELRAAKRPERERVIRWEEGICSGFLTLPILEDLRATIRAHLERQFRRPEVRR